MMTTTASFLFSPCPLFCSTKPAPQSRVGGYTSRQIVCVIGGFGLGWLLETPHRLQAWVLGGTSLAVPIRRASGTKC